MLSGKEEIMEYFDLHCDTLYRAVIDGASLINDKYHISLDKSSLFDKWVQHFAVWIPDEIKGEYATCFFNKAVELYKNEYITDASFEMRLSVENASMLNGKIENISLLTENQVRCVTLTWNGKNEIGSGADIDDGSGLTDFGKEVIKELENNKIAIDLSHASDKLFYDVISLATKPVLATHSNSRTVTDVKRNLTDDQFKIVRDSGGIVGLNFYKGFLRENENKACIDDLVRHAEHFLNLNGENTLAIGSDFDGADMPYDIEGINTVPAIYKRFEAEFGAKLTKKIFFDNANMYFTNFDNM